MNICLCNMTHDLAQELFDGFQYDPDTFSELEQIPSFIYSEDWVNHHIEKQNQEDRKYLAIMVDGTPAGEIIFKNINAAAGCCTMSIHLKNDSVKNRGIGTAAEKLALQYVFEECKMNAVYADALIKNCRSRHVLEKIGFREYKRDTQFCYYIYKKDTGILW